MTLQSINPLLLSTFIEFENFQKTLEFRIRGRHFNEVVGIRYDTGKKSQHQDN